MAVDGGFNYLGKSTGTTGTLPSALGSYAGGGEAYTTNAAPSGSNAFQSAYNLYSNAAAPQMQAYQNTIQNLYAQGGLMNALTGNSIAALQAQYGQQRNDLNLRNQNNAIDLNNLASRITTNSKMGDLAQADIATLMRQLAENEGTTNRTYDATVSYRNNELGLAQNSLANMMEFLQGQRGFSQQTLDQSIEDVTRTSDRQRRDTLADAAARGATASNNVRANASDIEGNRGLGMARANTTYGRAISDIDKAGKDAQGNYDSTANGVNYALTNAGIARDSTMADIIAAREKGNTQYQRNILDYGQNDKNLRADYDKLKNLGDSFGVTAQQMGDALNRGIAKLGLEGQIDVLGLTNQINSTNAQQSAAALQILQMALANAGYAPATPATSPGANGIPGYTPTYNAGNGVRVM